LARSTEEASSDIVRAVMAGVGSIVLLALAIDAQPDLERAKTLAADAEIARAAGELDRALELLRAAHALTGSPALLNNTGLVLESLGRYAEAAEAYRAVVASPDARDELRAIDMKRLAVLEPRLGRAWIVAADALWIDGEMSGPEERAFAPGIHVIEAKTERGAVIRALAFVAGVRRTLTLAEIAAQPGDASLLLSALPPDVASITVDGYRARSAPLAVPALILAPGTHKVEIALPDGTSRVVTLALAAGAQVDLAAHLEDAPPEPELTLVVAPAPSEPGPRWAPWVLSTAGAVAAGAGVILYVTAESDRADLTAQLGDGSTIVRTVTEADAVATQSSADVRASLGTVLIGAGAAALVGAFVLLW